MFDFRRSLVRLLCLLLSTPSVVPAILVLEPLELIDVQWARQELSLANPFVFPSLQYPRLRLPIPPPPSVNSVYRASSTSMLSAPAPSEAFVFDFVVTGASIKAISTPVHTMRFSKTYPSSTPRRAQPTPSPAHAASHDSSPFQPSSPSSPTAELTGRSLGE